MKTKAEIEDAAKLLAVVLTGQITLPPPWGKENEQQLLAACRTLQWVLDLPSVLPMDQLLVLIIQELDGQSYNPHQTLNE